MRIFGTSSVVALGATPPSLTGVLAAIQRSTLVIPLPLVSTQVSWFLTGEPMYSNLRASNSIPLCPITWPMTREPIQLTIVKPSGLATL